MTLAYAQGKPKDKPKESTEACDISMDVTTSTSIRLRAYKLWQNKSKLKGNSFYFVFVNLRRKFILCYVAYTCVASENEA